MAGKSCFLIGHREICGNISQILETEIEKHITQYGVSEFIVGEYGEFDRLAASVLFRVRQRYPSIRILLLLPYFPIPNLKEKAKDFDDTFFPPGMEKYPADMLSSGLTGMLQTMLIILLPMPGIRRAMRESLLNMRSGEKQMDISK